TATHTASTSRARTPKNTTEATTAGTRAMSTSLMMVCVVIPSWRWGETDTVRFLAIHTRLLLLLGLCLGLLLGVVLVEHSLGQLVHLDQGTLGRADVGAAAALHA